MNSNKIKNVLAIGAHYDDIELGCGGILKKFSKLGIKTYGLVVTNSKWISPDNVKFRENDQIERDSLNASNIIGFEYIEGKSKFQTCKLIYNDDLICFILREIEKYKIDTVFTHSIHDVHQDHFAVAKSSITSSKNVPRVLMYQSNWYDTGESFNRNFYCDITEEFDSKILALNCYKSEMERKNKTWLDWIKYYHRINGMKFQCEYAEVFEVVKYLIDL